MINYIVTFNLDGKKHAKPVEAVNPGSAFFKVLRKWPEAKLIQCQVVGRLAGQHMMPIVTQTYEPPKNQDMGHIGVVEQSKQELMPWG